jgi:hypothetical protein
MDDWSLLPSRNAVSEPAPNPKSTMNTTTLAARLTHPRQAPKIGIDLPRPQYPALDPAGAHPATGNQSGAKPQNTNDLARPSQPTSHTRARNINNPQTPP